MYHLLFFWITCWGIIQKKYGLVRNHKTHILHISTQFHGAIYKNKRAVWADKKYFIKHKMMSVLRRQASSDFISGQCQCSEPGRVQITQQHSLLLPRGGKKSSKAMPSTIQRTVAAKDSQTARGVKFCIRAYSPYLIFSAVQTLKRSCSQTTGYV